MNEGEPVKAWLVRTSGPMAGARRVIGDITRIGRNPDNDIVLDETTTISGYHLEVRREHDTYKIRDLNSTNGTFVNGERIVETTLLASSLVQLGATGPELRFVLEETPILDLNQTVETEMAVAATGDLPQKSQEGAPISQAHEALLSKAVARARLARSEGVGNQTIFIMREMLDTALHRTRRKFTAAIGVLLLVLFAVTLYGSWKINLLKSEKSNIDKQIANIESRFARAELTDKETEQLADRLDTYEDQARALETTLLYKVGVRQHVDPVERNLASLMAEFGAETYSIPPEFLEQVKRFIGQIQGSDRPHMVAALNQSHQDVATMKQLLEQAHLPPDFAYMAVVESAVSNTNTSSAGAAGVWQFTPATAAAYGLKIGKDFDERLDVQKSTQAACKLLRDLILDFGAGSSVMLALAAYNSGSARVKEGIRKVSDPIKQRNFWHLYRVRALPVETREYVPKVIAAMIVARDPAQFGF